MTSRPLQTRTDLARHTARFHEWERRGRGVDTYPHLVELEPPFQPFQGHRAFGDIIIDDGRRPTMFSRLIDRIVGRASFAEAPVRAAEEDRIREAAVPDGRTTEFEMLVPPEQKIDPASLSALLNAIGGAMKPIAFEVVGYDGHVAIRLACDPADATFVRSQIAAFIPLAIIEAADPSLLHLWRRAPTDVVAGAEFVLAREFMIPFRDSSKGSEGLATLVGALSQAAAGELAVAQILFTPARAPWFESALAAVTSPDGEPFFIDAPDVTKLATEKLSARLYAVVVRSLVTVETQARADSILRGVAAAFRSSARELNSLVPVEPEDVEDFQFNVLLRCTNRSGMLLSLPELCSLARLPGAEIRSPALIRTRVRKRLPAGVLEEGIIIGEAEHENEQVPVHLPLDARLSHTYVVGASGTGKSTLMENMILQDIEAGHGVAVLDPHGDLIDELLGRIPEGRAQDVVLFDPSDPEWVVGWNILGAQSDVEKEMLASDLVAVWRRLSTSWGDQMTAVLSNAVLAFLESSIGGTLVDLRKFLLDAKFRAAFLDTVKEDHVRSFWRDEFPLLIGRRPEAPILTRLDTLLRSRFVREAMVERDKPLDFRTLMDGRKIFLGKLAQGAIGEENAALLGSLLVSKFHQTALSRQDVASEAREPFFMYIDEFQNMATPSMASLFSGVRKFKLAMCVAHQDLFQVQSVAPELQRSILASAHTRIVFRVSEEDARQIQRGMGAFGEAELVDLERGEAICRFGKGSNTFAFRTLTRPSIDAVRATTTRDRLRAESLARFGRRRDVASPSERVTEIVASDLPGRGGKHHKYLQSFIKKAAEKRGFEVTLEKRVLDGQGHVDVALTMGDVSVACEISVSTGLAHELENVSKCLTAGYQFVVLVAAEQAKLDAADAQLQATLPPDLLERIRRHTPATLPSFLDEICVLESRMSRESAASKQQRRGPNKVVAEVPIIPQDSEALLDAEQVSAYVRRAPQTLAKLRSIGGGPPFYKIGRNVYYKRSDVDDWLAFRKRRNTSDSD